MTTENSREAVLHSAQHLFEQHGRMPTVLEVRDHCGRSMRDTASVLADWLENQRFLQGPTQSSAVPDDELACSQLMKPLAAVIEVLAIRALDKVMSRAVHISTGRVEVLDTVAATCDAQHEELQDLRARLTVAESTASNIIVAAVDNERDAARREAALKEEITAHQKQQSVAEDKIRELEIAAQGRTNNLAEVQNTIESQQERISTLSVELESSRAQISLYEKQICDVAARSAQLHDFKETLNSLFEKADDFHERSARMREKLVQLTGSTNRSLNKSGSIKKPYRARRPNIVHETE